MQLIQWDFLEQGQAEDLQDFTQANQEIGMLLAMAIRTRAETANQI
jgi:hypothetical protein